MGQSCSFPSARREGQRGRASVGVALGLLLVTIPDGLSAFKPPPQPHTSQRLFSSVRPQHAVGLVWDGGFSAAGQRRRQQQSERGLSLDEVSFEGVPAVASEPSTPSVKARMRAQRRPKLPASLVKAAAEVEEVLARVEGSVDAWDGRRCTLTISRLSRLVGAKQPSPLGRRLASDSRFASLLQRTHTLTPILNTLDLTCALNGLARMGSLVDGPIVAALVKQARMKAAAFSTRDLSTVVHALGKVVRAQRRGRGLSEMVGEHIMAHMPQLYAHGNGIGELVRPLTPTGTMDRDVGVLMREAVKRLGAWPVVTTSTHTSASSWGGSRVDSVDTHVFNNAEHHSDPPSARDMANLVMGLGGLGYRTDAHTLTRLARVCASVLGECGGVWNPQDVVGVAEGMAALTLHTFVETSITPSGGLGVSLSGLMGTQQQGSAVGSTIGGVSIPTSSHGSVHGGTQGGGRRVSKAASAALGALAEVVTDHVTPTHRRGDGVGVGGCSIDGGITTAASGDVKAIAGHADTQDHMRQDTLAAGHIHTQTPARVYWRPTDLARLYSALAVMAPFHRYRPPPTVRRRLSRAVEESEGVAGRERGAEGKGVSAGHVKSREASGEAKRLVEAIMSATAPTQIEAALAAAIEDNNKDGIDHVVVGTGLQRLGRLCLGRPGAQARIHSSLSDGGSLHGLWTHVHELLRRTVSGGEEQGMDARSLTSMLDGMSMLDVTVTDEVTHLIYEAIVALLPAGGSSRRGGRITAHEAWRLLPALAKVQVHTHDKDDDDRHGFDGSADVEHGPLEQQQQSVTRTRRHALQGLLKVATTPSHPSSSSPPRPLHVARLLHAVASLRYNPGPHLLHRLVSLALRACGVASSQPPVPAYGTTGVVAGGGNEGVRGKRRGTAGTHGGAKGVRSTVESIVGSGRSSEGNVKEYVSLMAALALLHANVVVKALDQHEPTTPSDSLNQLTASLRHASAHIRTSVINVAMLPPHHLPHLAHSVAALEGSGAKHWMDGPLATRTLIVLPSLHPHALANILNAMASAGAEPGSKWVHAVMCALPAICTRRHTRVRVSDVASMVVALGAMDAQECDERAWRCVADAIEAAEGDDECQSGGGGDGGRCSGSGGVRGHDANSDAREGGSDDGMYESVLVSAVVSMAKIDEAAHTHTHAPGKMGPGAARVGTELETERARVLAALLLRLPSDTVLSASEGNNDPENAAHTPQTDTHTSTASHTHTHIHATLAAALTSLRRTQPSLFMRVVEYHQQQVTQDLQGGARRVLTGTGVLVASPPSSPSSSSSTTSTSTPTGAPRAASSTSDAAQRPIDRWDVTHDQNSVRRSTIPTDGVTVARGGPEPAPHQLPVRASRHVA